MISPGVVNWVTRWGGGDNPITPLIVLVAQLDSSNSLLSCRLQVQVLSGMLFVGQNVWMKHVTLR